MAVKIASHCQAHMLLRVGQQLSELRATLEVSVFQHHLTLVRRALYLAQPASTLLPSQGKTFLVEHVPFAQLEIFATVEILDNKHALQATGALKGLNSAHNSLASTVPTILIQVGQQCLFVLLVQLVNFALKGQ